MANDHDDNAVQFVQKMYKDLDLVGRVFTGRYLGVRRHQCYRTFKAVFEINEENEDNGELLGLFRSFSDKTEWFCKAKVWGGYSCSCAESEDSDSNCALWIWTPKSCALHPSHEDQEVKLEIRSVEFELNKQYRERDNAYGVNIRVQLLDSYRTLERDYEELQGVHFAGSYIGYKPDAVGNWRPVFEVPKSVPLNARVIEMFEKIRDSWERDGKRVLKSFTDGKDSHKGYDWDLRIWGSQRSDLEVPQDAHSEFIITGVVLQECGSGKYGWTADIDVDLESLLDQSDQME